MEEHEEVEPRPLPRWITMPLGVIFVPITLLCVVGSALILVAPNVPPSIMTVSLGSLLLAGSLWVFYLSLRLLFVSPKGSAKFISPVGLRIIALLFATIPVVSVALGAFWEKPIINSLMTIAYIGIVLRLWGIAGQRGKNA
jgi:hypothetical protein